ncbi:SDR family NAD(P)-dependent oxidoreductase [Novosphingobium kaempferiae]|uniref:SDR family NAD(P)-dependent oxidoreductase n=1 Tax=Novosphingobium kaempferiae TaxID=2896849 RepID=UPI001E579136|nr:SDR family NAD(P)-dependent oxidoreductase [Novosphingobium kaempferiae]
MNLEGKKTAIIGGASGIGREIALRLARAGGSVLIGDVDINAAQVTAGELRGLGFDATAETCDLGDDRSVAHFADRAFATLGTVDLLFNHAGASVGGMLEDVTPADWNWMLNINLTGLGRSISAFLPRMAAQGGGWIINTSSGAGLFHDVPLAAPYLASKAAIIALSRSLATYALNRGIGVSVFCPDMTDTGFLKPGRLRGIPAELMAASMPSHRLQTAQEAADVLIDGLKAGKFLISAFPGTKAKLQNMAAAEMLPASDAWDEHGGPVPIVQKATIHLPEANLGKAVDVLREAVPAFRKHVGCRAYEYAISPEAPGTISLFEVWNSQAELDAHAATPETIAAIGQIAALGMTSFAAQTF